MDFDRRKKLVAIVLHRSLTRKTKRHTAATASPSGKRCTESSLGRPDVITRFKFMPDGRVEAQPLEISEETLFSLEDNLLLFTRSSASVNFIVIFRSLWPLVSTHVPSYLGRTGCKAAWNGDVF